MKLQPLTPDELGQLVEIAERSIHQAVLGRQWHPDPIAYSARLRQPGAVFVTLRQHHRLRGCVGTLTATEPLVMAVADRAKAAAFDDPRLPGVRLGDLADLEVSVSVLSAPEPMAVNGVDELVAAIRPGVDGVVIEADRHHATFLPAVWDDLPHPQEFVDALWRKAGMTPGTWPDHAVASRYTAQHS